MSFCFISVKLTTVECLLIGNNRRMEKLHAEENVKLSLHLAEHFALNIVGRRRGGGDNSMLQALLITLQSASVPDNNKTDNACSCKHCYRGGRSKYYMFRVFVTLGI